MADVTDIFGGPWRLPTPVAIDDQIRQAMAAAGITPPPSIELDGKLHRWQTGSKGKAGYDKPGWYVFFADGIPAGMFGDWRMGIASTWRAEVGRPLTIEEEAAITRRQAEARTKRDALADQVAETVDIIWSQAGAASDDHPYLARKGVKAHGLRITGDGRLIAPMFNGDGRLSSVQYIDAEGAKLYHSGGVARGSHWSVGVFEGADTIYIAEGFATAATIHEITGKPCVVSYSANNLVPVTEAIKGAYADAKVVIVADHDKGGTGQRYAEQAGAKHGAAVFVIPIPGMDANDYVQAGNDLISFLNPPVDQWLLQADEFSSECVPIRWLVKGWVQQEALVMVHGPSGGGKTFAVLDWALHMAAGIEIWNNCKVKPGPVVYLAGEGHQGLRSRIAAWKQHHGVPRLEMWLSKAGCDLNTSEGRQKVIDHVGALPTPPLLIIVDTVHRFLDGDENSSVDVRTMIESCAALTQKFGCTVILVHHTGVSEEAQHRARGSSAWRGALEIEISVVPGDPGHMQLIQRKAKDAEIAAPVAAMLKTIAIDGWVDEDGDPVKSAVIVASDEPEQIKTRKPSKIEIHQKLFTQAWKAFGDRRDGLVFLSREGFKRHLEVIGFAPGSVKNYLAPASAGKPIHDLLLAGFIEVSGDGWAIIEPGWVAQINLQEAVT